MKSYLFESEFAYGYDYVSTDLPNGPSKGGGANQRVGDNIRIISLDFSVSVTIPSFPATLLTPQSSLNFSFWVVLNEDATYHPVSDYVQVPSVADNAATGMWVGGANSKCLYRKTGTVERQINSIYYQAGLQLYNTGYQNQLCWDFTVPGCNFTSSFDPSSSGGTLGDFTANAVQVVGIWNVQGTALQITNNVFSYQCKTSFLDID